LSLLYEKFKEVLYSVLPIVALVLLLHFTLTPLAASLLTRFLIGSAFVIFGLTIFLAGVDNGITPIGNSMGSTIARSNKLWFVAIAGLILGFAIAVAEPDLHILAVQVDAVTSGIISRVSIVVVVSLGIAILLAIGLVRILFSFPLYKMLAITYVVILILALFTSPEFLAIAFDASGATTGALTVPFMLALAMGTSRMKKDSKSAEKDSFGLVGIASSGAILGVLVMGVISPVKELTGILPNNGSDTESVFLPFLQKIPQISFEVLAAMTPIIIIYFISRHFQTKTSGRLHRKTLFGLLFTFIGLVIFLVGVNAGFMEVGATVGYKLAMLESKFFIILVAFVVGTVTVLAEPAVNVLTHQIEDVTSGYVKRKAVSMSLSLGVGLAVALSIVRILTPGLQLWHYLLPGYIIAIAMMFFVPKLFVGIAFDSGGVASGPMTATFILAYAQGAAEAIEGASVMIDGFGVIAMVAMTPLIALQTLGLIFKVKSRKRGLDSDELE
jgi:hypothetical protein